MNPQQMALKDMREKEAEKKTKEMLRDITTCLETVGQVNPFNKVYKLLRQDLESFALVSMALSLNVLEKLIFDSVLFNLTKKVANMPVDGPHFIIGLVTIFKQFHFSHFKKFVLFMIHYIKTILSASRETQNQTKVLNADAIMAMTFLEETIKFEGS